jgi:hypothetical protein
MDLSFFRRAEQRFASRAAAHLDFGMLSAMLRAQGQTSAAARAQAFVPAPAEVADPIAEILSAGPCWQAAVAALGGSFNPAFARQRSVN